MLLEGNDFYFLGSSKSNREGQTPEEGQSCKSSMEDEDIIREDLVFFFLRI